MRLLVVTLELRALDLAAQANPLWIPFDQENL